MTTHLLQRDPVLLHILLAGALTLGLFLLLPALESIAPHPEPHLLVRALPATVLLPAPPEPTAAPPAPDRAPRRMPVPQLAAARPQVALPRPELPALSVDTLPAAHPNPPFVLSALLPPAAPGIYELSDLDRAPVPLLRPAPDYPPAARRRHLEGEVVVNFIVEADGTTRQPTIVSSQPPGVFDRSALRSVAAWRFSPGQKDGAPVPVRVSQPLRYRLGEP